MAMTSSAVSFITPIIPCLPDTGKLLSLHLNASMNCGAPLCLASRGPFDYRPAMQAPQTSAEPARFLNRELSWLEFNQRVLEEARHPATPLLERLKFFCITSSNLDEFFEVRVAGLKEQIENQTITRSFDGQTPLQTL